MFLTFTPYTFLYLVFYFMFLSTFFISTGFLWCWLAIEILILLFIGISYTLFGNSFSSLLVYFLVQVFSSFSLLIFYIYRIPLLFTLSIMLKLSLFPFHSWFISSVYSFPNFMLYIASTFHKVPIFLILMFYSLPINYLVLWSSILFTFLVSGFLILSTNDFRLLLVLSSVGNNSWLLLSSFSGINTFIIYTFIYFISLFILFFTLGSSSKPFVFRSHSDSSSVLALILVFISLTGLPPFPLFFSKMYIVYRIFTGRQISSSLLLLTVFCRSFLLIGYLSLLIKILVYSYCSSSRFIFLFKNQL